VIRTQDAIKYLRGELGKAADVDLFDRSQSAWLRTPGGTWFIPTKSGYFFLNLTEEDGTWKVGKTANGYRKQGHPSLRYTEGRTEYLDSEAWGWLRKGLPLDYAMTAAEGLADDLDGSVSSRKASWRKTNSPSDGQKEQCRRLGIEIPDGARRGAVSDMISMHYATRLFDPRKA
jgi:hypothetical protein